MPVHTGKDSKGCFAQWGGQKKYYFECGNEKARERAKAKASKQGQAAHAAGYTGNEELSMKLQRIVGNTEGKVRYDRMEGRDYIVVPMTMLTEGVHAGSEGPLFYPSEELADTPGVWNHKPVVVYHPRGATACVPEVLTSSKVGVIMAARFEDNKLKAEAWLEESRIKEVDSRVMDAIENETPMELSTGLYCEAERVADGIWNDEKYTLIARNYRPDHLALLPDKKGACSLEDGAGFLVNEMSHDDVHRLIQGELRQKHGEGVDSPWASSIFDEYFIYEQNGSYYKQEYSLTDGSVEFVGEPQEVVKEITFRPKNSSSSQKENHMKKSDLIKALIANERTAWGEDDKGTLEQMDIDLLTKLMPVNEDEEPEDDPAEEPDAPADDAPAEEPAEDDAPADEPDAPAEDAPTANMSLKDWLKKQPAAVRNMVSAGIKTYNAEKKKLANIILANEACTFTEQQLLAKSPEELQAIVKLARNARVEEDDDLLPDFGGQIDPVTTNQSKQEPLGIPVINFESKEK